MSIGFQPNVCGPLVELVNVLRQQHNEQRERIKERIAERNKAGAPLADLDFAKLADDADGLAKRLREMDVPGALGVVEKLSAALSDLPSDPGEFVARDELAGISVKLRILSERERATLGGAYDDAREAVMNAASQSARANAYIDLRDARAAYVARACGHIDGLQEWNGDVIKPRSFSVDEPTGKLPDECLNLLRASGVLDDLFMACVDFQALPAKKAARFGLLPPAT